MNKLLAPLVLAVVFLGGCRGTRLQSPVADLKLQNPIATDTKDKCGTPVYESPVQTQAPETTCQVLPEMQAHLNCDPKTGLCYLPGHCGPVAKMETAAPGLQPETKPAKSNVDGSVLLVLLAACFGFVVLKGSRVI